MKKISLILIGALAVCLMGCADKQSDHGHDHSEEAHGHDHAHEETALSRTIWTDKTELFVQFAPLYVGNTTTFAVHVTDLSNFKAIAEGQLTISLIKGEKGIRHSVDAPSSPGIFTPALQPKSAGVYTLVFELTSPTFSDKIVVENVEVYADHEAADASTGQHEEHPDEIVYTKEQAWKSNFASVFAKRDTLYEILRAGGQILPAQGDEHTLSATTNGLVIYNSNQTVIGAKVSKGDALFTIADGDITDDNLETEYLTAKANYDLAYGEFLRHGELFKQGVIPKHEYEVFELEYQLAAVAFDKLAVNFSKAGKVVRAQSSGYIKELFLQAGEYVEIGEPMAIVSQNKRLTIQANVSPNNFGKLNNSMSANFVFNDNTYDIKDFNGRLLSYARHVDSDNPKIPVYFEIDNKGTLLPGSYIEILIKTNPTGKGVIVPHSALLEEYGKYSVIVQLEGEIFELREVQLGITDGLYAQIISGVDEGERVVTTGAYQVKMAAMKSEVPAHGHAH